MTCKARAHCFLVSRRQQHKETGIFKVSSRSLGASCAIQEEETFYTEHALSIAPIVGDARQRAHTHEHVHTRTQEEKHKGRLLRSLHG